MRSLLGRDGSIQVSETVAPPLAMSSTLALLTNRPILLRNKVATGFQRHIHWGLSYELTAASPRPSGRDKKVLLSNPRVDNESNQKYADELADLPGRIQLPRERSKVSSVNRGEAELGLEICLRVSQGRKRIFKCIFKNTRC